VNVDEETVSRYLHSLSLGEVVFEPGGGVPPDFLVGGRIAVEARRLNQHYEHDGRLRGLEEDRIPISLGFTHLLEEFGAPRDARTWFVFFGLRRPSLAWKQIRPLVRAALSQFLQFPVNETWRIPICEGFDITLLRSTTVTDRVFLVGGSTDFDEGGWMVSEVVRNVSAYMEQKASKVTCYLGKYPEWWLVLVDYIAYARGEDEVRKYIRRGSSWNRVVLISPIESRAYEI